MNINEFNPIDVIVLKFNHFKIIKQYKKFAKIEYILNFLKYKMQYEKITNEYFTTYIFNFDFDDLDENTFKQLLRISKHKNIIFKDLNFELFHKYADYML